MSKLSLYSTSVLTEFQSLFNLPSAIAIINGCMFGRYMLKNVMLHCNTQLSNS